MTVKVGIALSGAGVRAAASIGVIAAFQEYGIDIGAVSAISTSSYIAALYASGMDPLGMTEAYRRFLRMFYRRSIVDTVCSYFGLDYISGPDRLERFIQHGLLLFGATDFSDTHIPLSMTALDTLSNRVTLLSGSVGLRTQEMQIACPDLASAVRAAVAVPGFKRQRQVEGLCLCDASVRLGLPVWPLRWMGADRLVAVNPVLGVDNKHGLSPLKTSEIASSTNARHLYSRADVIIGIDADGVMLDEYEKTGQVVEMAKRQTIDQMPRILDALYFKV